MSDANDRRCSGSDAIVMVLLAIYGCTLLNIPTGALGAAYCQWKMRRAAQPNETQEWKDRRDRWLFSCIPIVGPPFAVYAYALSGIGA
jgi:membrane protein YqaA with SNARE-associated domain